jgi:hypothetical protein
MKDKSVADPDPERPKNAPGKKNKKFSFRRRLGRHRGFSWSMNVSNKVKYSVSGSEL